jgi:hypothetical protein
LQTCLMYTLSFTWMIFSSILMINHNIHSMLERF